MLPRIASGPITKSNDDETKPSTKVPSLFAPNLRRKFSPKVSKRSSSLRAEPINPPINKDPRMLSNVQPLGSSEAKLSLNNGMTAPAAARIVIKPKTSVIKSLVFTARREPASTPIVEPATMPTILIKVPNPIITIRTSWTHSIA